MTYPSPYPGPPQDPGGPQSSPYAPRVAYGQPPVSAPQAGAPYGQAPTPAGHGAYMPPEQLAIPTQSVHRSPGASVRPDHPYPSPSAQASAPQYQPYQSYQQHYQQGANAGSMYLSGAVVTAPGYSAGDRLLQPGYSHAGAASPQTIGAGHHVPWRGEKAAALVMMLVAYALEFVIYITFVLNFARGGWLNIVLTTIMFIVATPLIWWLYFGLRHLSRNQPVTEMVGLALWFGYGVLAMPAGVSDKDQYAGLQNVAFVLLFIVTAVGAVLTARLNQRLRSPRPWTITLALGACQFVLINSAVRLSYLGISAYSASSNGKKISQYTANAWFAWSDSGGGGLPMAPGMLILAAITSLAAAGFFLGMRSPSSRAFRITSTSAVSLLTLCNLVIVLAYGLPTRGEYAYRPSDAGIVVAVIIVMGAMLIGATLAAGRRPVATSPAGHGRYRIDASNAPNAQNMQNHFNQYHQPQSPMGGGY